MIITPLLHTLLCFQVIQVIIFQHFTINFNIYGRLMGIWYFYKMDYQGFAAKISFIINEHNIANSNSLPI